FYVLLAVVLVVVIVVIAYLLVTLGVPAFRGGEQPPASPSAATLATAVPTFTAPSTQAPTNTPPPSPVPTPGAPVMADTDDPSFAFESAGVRPSVEWTGFFGQVTDASGAPAQDVPVVVWYPDGQLAAPVSKTDASGYYEVRLSDTPLAGIWTIQILTEDLQPASSLFTFQTDEDTAQGIQQIQVLWEGVR
ncbi:MAG: hypothetical protein ACP5JJ_10270, partial [Anaerolineae bacterium]